VSEIVPLQTFASLNLTDRLLETLDREGYDTPTPIQAKAIPPLLEGRDLLGCAQTGTGKTAAFSLPLLHRLITDEKPRMRVPRALILAPTRELAGQIEDSLRTYGRGTGLRGAVIYGGVKQFRQVRRLESGVDVIVATPGRLLDLIEQGHIDLSAIEVFVLDEADRMLDMGFIHPIRQIASLLPSDRQTLLFSATMPPKIRQLADSMLRDPVSVSITPAVTTAPKINQTLYHVQNERKPALLAHLLKDEAITRTVVFTKTKHGAERLAKKLARAGVTADAIHGNKNQNQRQRALDAFRSGRTRALVATDVAARGLDVDGVTHVFNFNLPMEPEAYVHRIGRTGRAGAEGEAISFCARDERNLLRAVERVTGERLEPTRVPDDIESLEKNIAHAPAPPSESPKPRKKPARKPAHKKAKAKPGPGGAKRGKPRGAAKRKKTASSAGAPGSHAKRGHRGAKKKSRRAPNRPR